MNLYRKLKTLLTLTLALALLPTSGWAQEDIRKKNKIDAERRLKKGKLGGRDRGPTIGGKRILRPDIKLTPRKGRTRRGKPAVKGRTNLGKRRVEAPAAPRSASQRKGASSTRAAGRGPKVEVNTSRSGTMDSASGDAAADADGSLPGEREFNECIKYPKARRIKITLKQESDLMDLVGWISGMTCKKFIVATSLRSQKVTLVSPTPVTTGEAYRAFLSALEVMGLTVVPAGRYLKVVQGNWAIQSPIPIYGPDSKRRVPNSDMAVTRMVRVQNVDANELLLVLNKMKSRSGDITVYKASNMLIITDNASNVRRMTKIIQELDISVEGEKLWVVRIKNADVEEINKILTQIFNQKGAGARGGAKIGSGAGGEDVSAMTASKIVADVASNSLIIVASASSFSRIASLIKKLDVESEGVNQRINVYYLENGDAEEMSNTLASLTGGAVKGGSARRSRKAKKPAAAGGGGSATLFEGDVKISSDKATNSLVIVASPRDFMNLRTVIRKLDKPRRQVFIEASILEIGLSTNRQLGFAYHGGGMTGEGQSQSVIFGAVQHPDWQSLVISPLSLMGLAAGARGAPIQGSNQIMGFGADLPSFSVMFQALQGNTDVNTLSSPHILTTDNEEAEISVGQNIPFQGGFMGGGMSSMAGAAGGMSMMPTVSVQRQDVALKLKITPHVNESDMVRLELDQEVSDIAETNFGGTGLGPSTSKRTIKTVVVVRDQQTVVLGGLMETKVQNVVSKVPLLGDIPIIGYLFKHTKKVVAKTNLLIILTPYIIRDQSDLRRIFRKKMNDRREYIERYTSFSSKDLSNEIDFRHKRGLLSEINKVGIQAEQEAELLHAAEQGIEEEVDPVELPKEMMAPAESTSASDAGDTGRSKTGTHAPVIQ